MPALGDRVKDKITGFTGIIIAKTSYLQGCDRVAVKSEALHEGKPIDSHHFDEMEVEVIDTEVVARVEYAPPMVATGGPRLAPDRT